MLVRNEMLKSRESAEKRSRKWCEEHIQIAESFTDKKIQQNDEALNVLRWEIQWEYYGARGTLWRIKHYLFIRSNACASNSRSFFSLLILLSFEMQPRIKYTRITQHTHSKHIIITHFIVMRMISFHFPVEFHASDFFSTHSPLR